MYKCILLAYDGSKAGQQALLNCREIAQWSRSKLHLVAVMPPAPTYIPVEGGFFEGGQTDETIKSRYQGILEDGLQRLDESGHAAQGEVLIGDPVEEITAHASAVGADLIVVGHRHLDSWAARWWRGSATRSLIDHAHCSVLVVITH